MHRIIKRELKGTLLFGSLGVLTKAVGFIITPLLVRSLSLDDFGKYDLYRNFVAVSIFVMVLGNEQATARILGKATSREDRNIIISSGLLILCCSILVVFFLLLLFNGLFNDYIGLTESYYFWVYLFSLPGASLMVYMLMVFKWEDRLNNYVLVSVISLSVMLSFALYFAWYDSRLETLVLSYLVSGLLNLSLGVLLLREFLVKPTPNVLKEIASGLVPIFIASIALNVTPFLERQVVSSESNFESVAIFSSIVVVIRLLRFPMDSYYTAWQPMYSNSFSGKIVPDGLLDRVLRINLLWKMLVLVIIYGFGSELLMFIFNGKILIDIKTFLALTLAYGLDFSLGVYGFKYMMEKKNLLMIVGNLIPILVLLILYVIVETNILKMYALILAGLRLFWFGVLSFYEDKLQYWFISLILFVAILLV